MCRNVDFLSVNLLVHYFLPSCKDLIAQLSGRGKGSAKGERKDSRLVGAIIERDKPKGNRARRLMNISARI